MNVLIVYAHPEPASLNGALKDIAVRTLTAAGHEVQVSDLYAMRWKASADLDDYRAVSGERLRVMEDSGLAYERGLLTPDVAAEQEKLLWADAVVFQFPLWWYSVPAILKGWFDRVFTFRFAYGVGEHSDVRYGDRFGEGRLVGKRALLSVTIGGSESSYAERGINGPIDDLLFPIQHGTLYHPGMSILPPFTVYKAGRVDDGSFADIAVAWEERLLALGKTEPIAYRVQNAGDYEMPSLLLKPGLERPGTYGMGIHTA